jgi:hypothetical protein
VSGGLLLGHRGIHWLHAVCPGPLPAAEGADVVPANRQRRVSRSRRPGLGQKLRVGNCVRGLRARCSVCSVRCQFVVGHLGRDAVHRMRQRILERRWHVPVPAVPDGPLRPRTGHGLRAVPDQHGVECHGRAVHQHVPAVPQQLRGSRWVVAVHAMRRADARRRRRQGLSLPGQPRAPRRHMRALRCGLRTARRPRRPGSGHDSDMRPLSAGILQRGAWRRLLPLPA